MENNLPNLEDCCAEEVDSNDHPDVLDLNFQLGERVLEVFHADKKTDVGIILDSLNLP